MIKRERKLNDKQRKAMYARTNISLQNRKSKLPSNLTMKERMAILNGDVDENKKRILSNTDVKMTHQEKVNYNSHPDRKREREQQDENRRAEMGGLAGRTEHYIEQGVGEDDAFDQAMSDLGIKNPQWQRLRNKPENERRY